MLLTKNAFLLHLEQDESWFSKKRFAKSQLNEDLVDSVVGIADNYKIALALGCYFKCSGVFLESDKIIDILINPAFPGTLRSGLFYFAEAAGLCVPGAINNINRYIRLSRKMTDAIFNSDTRFYISDKIGNFVFDLTNIDEYISTIRGRNIVSDILDFASTQITNVSNKSGGNTVFDVFYYDYFVGNKKAIGFFTDAYYFGSNTISSKVVKMLYDSNIFTANELVNTTRKILKIHGLCDSIDTNTFLYSKTFVKTITPYMTDRLDPNTFNANKLFKHFINRGLSIDDIAKFMRLDRVSFTTVCSCSKLSDDDIIKIINDDSLGIIIKIFELDSFASLRPRVYVEKLDEIIQSLAIKYIKENIPTKINKYIENDLIDVSVDVKVDKDAILLLEELEK